MKLRQQRIAVSRKTPTAILNTTILLISDQFYLKIVISYVSISGTIGINDFSLWRNKKFFMTIFLLLKCPTLKAFLVGSFW